MVWPIKARVTAATSARREELAERASPQTNVRPLSPQVEECINTNPWFVLRQPFVSSSPMHHKHTEKKHTLRTPAAGPAMQPIHDPLPPNTTTGAQQEYMQSDNRKHKENCSLINQSDFHHAKLGKRHRVRLKWCQGQRRSLTDGFIGSISIHSACWLTEGGGGGGSMLYQWMQVAVCHSRPHCSRTQSTELKKKKGSSHPPCTRPHTDTTRKSPQ